MSTIWSWGRARGRINAINVGDPIIISLLVDDTGVLHRNVTYATYQGGVYDTPSARIRLTMLDPRFAKQNIATDPTVHTELAVDIQRVQRRVSSGWARVRVTPPSTPLADVLAKVATLHLPWS